MNESVINFIRSEYCEPIQRECGIAVDEPDEYSKAAIQLCVFSKDEVRGAARIILGEDNQVTNKLALPWESNYAELSRLVVHHEHRKNISTLFALLTEAHQVARENNITHFIAMANRQSEKIFRAFGFSCTYLQRNIEYFGWMTNAVKWEVGPAQARLEYIKPLLPAAQLESLRVARL